MNKSRDCEDKLQLIQNMVNNIDLMATLFYEIKTESPLGKTITILLNLYYQVGLKYIDGMLLNDIPISQIAKLAEISESELLESLKFLKQQGIILYKPIGSQEI